MDMKKIVIAFSVLLMISGGAISVLKWLEIGPFAPVVVEEVVEVVPDEPPVTIPMDDLVIPIFSDDSVAATVMIRLSLEAYGGENEDKINKILPRLSDAFLRDLYTFIPRIVRKQKKLTAAILQERLLMTGGKVVGDGVINKVMIESVTER